MTLTPEQIRVARSVALPGRDTVAEIIADLSQATGIPEADIRGKSRKSDVSQLRQMAMSLARLAGLSQPVTAACFGVDRSTVYHAEKAFSAQLAKPVFRSVRPAAKAEKESDQ